MHVIGATHHPNHAHKWKGGVNHVKNGFEGFGRVNEGLLLLIALPEAKLEVIKDDKQIDDT